MDEEKRIDSFIDDVNKSYKKSHGLTLFAINKYSFWFIVIAAFVSVVASTFFSYKIHQKVSLNSEKVALNSDYVQLGIQRLEAGMTWAAVKQKTTLYMRDEILRSSEPVSKTLAYDIAKNNFERCAEIYRNIDPLFLLAIQYVESKFKIGIVSGVISSPAGARGINQTMPLTAKFIVRQRNLQWNETYLTDPVKNTDVAIHFLDQLISEGYSKEEILSIYNCCTDGPYRMKNNSLPEETKAYIPAVLSKYEEYKRGLDKYEVVTEPSTPPTKENLLTKISE